MIIHSTFTDGYFEYAKLFLRSLKSCHDEDYRVIFTTTDLVVDQLEQLKEIYDNLEIYNFAFDYKPICEALCLPLRKVRHLKTGVEHDQAMMADVERVKWKLYVAAEKRVKIDIPFVMNQCDTGGLIAHFDIDMYFRKPLDPIFDIIRQNDFSTICRPKIKQLWRRTFICIMGIKTNNNGHRFMRTWGKELDSIPLKDKPFGFGQTSCWTVYKKLQDKMELGNIPEWFVTDAIKKGKKKRKLVKKALIWSANNPRGGNKDQTLIKFRKDFHGS